MILISGNGGGTELKNALKFGWAVMKHYSKNPSKPFNPYNQLYIKCKFYNITHVPFLAASNNAFLALSS